MRVVLLVALKAIDRGLDELADARHRMKWRRFQADHPDVRFPRYPDGG